MILHHSEGVFYAGNVNNMGRGQQFKVLHSYNVVITITVVVLV